MASNFVEAHAGEIFGIFVLIVIAVLFLKGYLLISVMLLLFWGLIFSYSLYKKYKKSKGAPK